MKVCKNMNKTDHDEDYLTHLFDSIDEDDRGTDVNITNGPNGILVAVQGYGDMPSPDGQGQPILIEKYNGELRVVIWSDINQEDPTHIISLEGAREDKRLEEKCPSQVDKHSVNCYFCAELVDERECVDADEYNDGDGGTICPKCQSQKEKAV